MSWLFLWEGRFVFLWEQPVSVQYVVGLWNNVSDPPGFIRLLSQSTVEKHRNVLCSVKWCQSLQYCAARAFRVRQLSERTKSTVGWQLHWTLESSLEQKWVRSKSDPQMMGGWATGEWWHFQDGCQSSIKQERVEETLWRVTDTLSREKILPLCCVSCARIARTVRLSQKSQQKSFLFSYTASSTVDGVTVDGAICVLQYDVSDDVNTAPPFISQLQTNNLE